VLTIRATVIAVLMALVLSWSLPASAGGPTSALLSVPGAGRTASLYYTDAAYDELSRLVGAGGATGSVDGSGRDHASGTGVTVTWLIHDVTPWRLDRIYLGADGGPWIATQEMGESGSIWDSPVVWHRPPSGKELSALLDRLGMGAGTPAPGAAPEEPAADEDGPAGPWWGLGGLVAGALLALGWTRVASARSADRDAGLDPDKDYLVPAPRA
jgi:hypothetical protein